LDSPWRFRPPPHPSIRPIQAFDDNYVWLLRAPDGVGVAVVDPGDASPVLAVLERENLRLTAILLTHHHADHVGGVAELCERWPAAVYGPRDERIAGVAHVVGDGDRFVVPGLDAEWRVIEVPGHTRSHVAYFARRVGADPRPVLFCGDTLFAAGCGRVFEGTAGQMLDSLSRLAALPPDTLAYCAHEYTRSNLRFAAAVEPDSGQVALRAGEAGRMREAGEPTVPFRIGDELATNPFLRTSEPAVRKAAAARLGRDPRDPAETFAAIREWKNVFR
jgi:hydroxyacylglutathione hydrolase